MTGKQKKSLIKIGVAAVLFAAGAFLDNIPLLIAAYVISGYETVIEAVMGIVNRQFLDENFLMTIASIGAIYCGEYPEAVAVMLFYKIGEFFEHYAVNSSRKSIADLMDIKADFATKVTRDPDGHVVEETVEPEDLVPGDIILIRPGEKVPVDGTVTEGNSSLNTAALTGESMPQDVTEGAAISSGTINLTGALLVEVNKPYEDSTVAKVLDLVENASSRKADIESFITRFARYYTPVVVALAILLAVLPPVLKLGTFAVWLYRAMIFLVISCPCALVISVPLSLFAGIGSASKEGILVKGSNYLEALANVNTFAFDKTGTLTEGQFSVVKVVPAEGFDADQLLEIAAHCESHSTHPIAKSITAHFGKTDSDNISDYEEVSGKGVSCIYKGKKVYCGNNKLLSDLELECPEETEMGSVVYVAVALEDHSAAYLGHIVVADSLRDNAKSTIEGLKKLGVSRAIMLTGDKKEVAENIGMSLGMTSIKSELLPGDKVSEVESALTLASAKRGHLAFVGDGINDAPVLARADVGIAMGAFGSDAAIEAADVVIMADDISKLVTVTKIARKTMRISKENVIFALVVKFAILILGALGLATMWAAVFADVGVAVIAILNALRAMKV